MSVIKVLFNLIIELINQFLFEMDELNQKKYDR